VELVGFDAGFDRGDRLVADLDAGGVAAGAEFGVRAQAGAVVFAPISAPAGGSRRAWPPAGSPKH
jgi:hypothetical protein